MRYSVVALALAGAVTALPSRAARAIDTVVKVVQQVDVVTDVVTVIGNAPESTLGPELPAPSTFVEVITVQASPTPAPAKPTPQPAPPSSAVPHFQPPPASSAAAPVSQPSAATGTSSGGQTSGSPTAQDMLDVANKWRTAYGHPTFTWNDELAGNAQKTGTDDDGVNEKHELNTISMAQVITPGLGACTGHDCGTFVNSFEMAYVSGWLCEKPEFTLTAAICKVATALGGMDLSSGETGHADILNNPDYKAIGCFFAPNANAKPTDPWDGLWTCDLM